MGFVVGIVEKMDNSGLDNSVVLRTLFLKIGFGIKCSLATGPSMKYGFYAIAAFTD